MENKKQIELDDEEIKELEIIFIKYDYNFGCDELDRKIIKKYFPNFKFYNNLRS